MIIGFTHCYLINHWYSIVTDQLRTLLASGLYDASEIIKVGVIGAPSEVELLQKLVIDQYPKFKVCYTSENPEDFEFRTLMLIRKTPGHFAGYYFHTKAVTKPFDTIQNHWRFWLNEAILNRWEKHYQHIIDGYDVSSVNHCKPPLHPEHFSGNFWWFKRDYINRLPLIEKMDWKYRWAAEQWICRGHGKYFAEEFVEPGRDVFKIKYHV